MAIEKVISLFNRNQSIPYDTISSVIEQKTEVTPILLKVLQEVIDNYEEVDPERIDFLVAMSLLAKFRETAAFDYILKIAQLPKDWTEDYLGDYMTEGLASCIVSTYDTDLTAIKSLIENERANLWCRGAGLSSLLGLISIGKLTRSEVVEYFRYLFNTHLIKDREFATQLVNECDSIYPEELYPEISKLFKQKLIDTFFINEMQIKETLDHAKDEHLQHYIYRYKFHQPINDIVDNIGWVYNKEAEEVFIDPKWETEEIKQIADAFNSDTFPYDIVNSALEQKDTLTPLLLKIIDQVITHYDHVDPSRKDYIIAMHLLAKFKEPLAFDYIIKFAEFPGFWTEYLLRDLFTEGLARFIISTYNGNLTAIKTVIENESLIEGNRIACLESLVGLYAIGKLSREELIDYYKYLYNSALINNISFTTALATFSYIIFPDELLYNITKMFNKKLVDLRVINLSKLKMILKVDKEIWLQEYVFTSKSYMPIGDLAEETAYLYAILKEEEHECNIECNFPDKQIKIGRNDICSCGSDKKYKKCCLKTI